MDIKKAKRSREYSEEEGSGSDFDEFAYIQQSIEDDDSADLDAGSESGSEEMEMGDDVDETGEAKETEPFYPDLFYDSEDSENEREILTIGNVPLSWYEDFDHVGYDLEGKLIKKPGTENEIDKLLGQDENPWSVFNEKTGVRESISARDMEIIQRIKSGKEDERYSWDNWFTELNEHTDHIHPLTNKPGTKRQFLPSRWEARRIRRLTWAIQKGYIKLDEAKKEKPKPFLIWDQDAPANPAMGRHISAPKMPLPGHAESYNPPEEYLFDEEEKLAWEALDAEDRKISAIPQKNSSLRTTPGYDNFQRERFQRCLDLYLAVRAKKKRWVVDDPNSLLPKIPRPSELKPFPSQLGIVYEGHEGYIRSIDVDPTGQWLLSGSDDNTVRLWEVATGRQLHQWSFDAIIHKVSWNPSTEISLFLVVTEKKVFLVTPDVISSIPQKLATQKLFEVEAAGPLNEDCASVIEWKVPKEKMWNEGYRLIIEWNNWDAVKYATWHHKGDYFATVCPSAARKPVFIHQLSKRQTQNPFKKPKGLVQCVLFHPKKPYFFVATQTHVRVYNLAQQMLVMKLITGSRWISSMDIHPGGDNLIISSYDKRVCWFDLDLHDKPYKVLRYHKKAIRAAVYHPRYPLFASCSDDGHVHVFHGMVYNDLLHNAFIVPLKILKGHEVTDDLGVLGLVFHPHQPWLFSAGSDKTIRLFT